MASARACECVVGYVYSFGRPTIGRVLFCCRVYGFFPPPPRRESLLAYSVTTPFASSVPATCNTASKLLYDIALIIVVVSAVIIAIVVFVIFVTILFKYIILHAQRVPP